MTRHYVITLDGTPQVIATGLVPTDKALRTLSLQPNGANIAPVYVGASADLSSSNYGFRLEGAVDSVPPAPWILGEFDDGKVSAAEFYVLGTVGEKVHVFVVSYV